MYIERTASVNSFLTSWHRHPVRRFGGSKAAVMAFEAIAAGSGGYAVAPSILRWLDDAGLIFRRGARYEAHLRARIQWCEWCSDLIGRTA